jgi:uncharacterized Fe-S cluster-containing radical SAM superfamily protein
MSIVGCWLVGCDLRVGYSWLHYKGNQNAVKETKKDAHLPHEMVNNDYL